MGPIRHPNRHGQSASGAPERQANLGRGEARLSAGEICWTRWFRERPAGPIGSSPTSGVVTFDKQKEDLLGTFSVIKFTCAGCSYMVNRQENEGQMQQSPLYLTSKLVSAYVAHNPLPLRDLETLLRAVHHVFASCEAGEPEHHPAVAIRSSITPDYIVC